jgi:FO synthase
MLHGRISNIQTSWVKLGVKRTQVMLNGGANDLGGTLMEETMGRPVRRAHHHLHMNRTRRIHG